MVAVITIRYRAGSRDGFQKVGAARHGDAAARRDVDLGLVDAEGQRAFEHVPRFVVAISLARLPEARLAQRPRLPHPHPG
jgi:hypothetical protein